MYASSTQHSRKSIDRLFKVLLLCALFFGFGVDLVIPALPVITKELHASAALGRTLVSGYVFGFAISGFVSCVLSDAIGRRYLFLSGALGFALISLFPIFFANIHVVWVTRFLQGICIGPFALVRPVLSDVMNHEELPRKLTWLSSIWAIGPMLAPAIGGYLSFYLGWQACFYFFAISALAVFMLLYMVLPETHHKRVVLHPRALYKNVVILFRDRTFFGNILLMGLLYGLTLVSNTLMPYFVQDVLGYSVVDSGHIALCTGLMFMLGTCYCRKALRKSGMEKMIGQSVKFACFLSIVPLSLAYVLPQSLSLVVVAGFVLFFVCGILFPLTAACATLSFRNIAGTATATMNAFTFLVAGILGAVTSKWVIHTTLQLMLIYFLVLAACALTHRIFLRVPRTLS